MKLHRRGFIRAVAATTLFLPGAHGKARNLQTSQLTSSTASLSGFSFEESLDQLVSLGFGGVEILTFTGKTHSVGSIPGAVVADVEPAAQKRIRNKLAKFQFVTTHLPFHDLRPADYDPEVRKRSLDLIERGIQDSRFWGASVGTLHVAPEQDFRIAWKDLLDTYRRLGDLAAKNNLKLGIETGTPSTVDEYLQLVRDIDHDHVGATVDTGHTRSYRKDAGLTNKELGSPRARQIYNDLMMKKVEGLGSKLLHFHVDDVRSTDWREHRKMGAGIVDWKRLLSHCDRINYRGAFAAELEEPDVVPALKESRELFKAMLAEIN